VKFTLEFEVDEKTANLAGELLRNEFFDQTKGFGCYETFDWRSDVTPLPNEIKEDGTYVWRKGEKEFQGTRIICAWMWDGNGTLKFHIYGKKEYIYLSNTDCKKDYNWEIL
jgi:hypothetical protein